MSVRSPGVSAFNAAYRCTVLRVEEAGWDAVEVEFSVVGDMSLGRIQEPRASSLKWVGPRRRASGRNRPDGVHIWSKRLWRAAAAIEGGLMPFYRKQGVGSFEGLLE